MSSACDEDDVSLEKLPVSNLLLGSDPSDRTHARRGPVGDPHGEFGGRSRSDLEAASGVGEGYLSGSIPLVLRRLLQTVPLLLGITVLVFMLLQVTPGDPARTVAGIKASPATVNRVRKELGLDRSLPAQYLAYLNRTIHGNLGRSIQTRVPVTTMIAQRLPVTLWLIVAGVYSRWRSLSLVVRWQRTVARSPYGPRHPRRHAHRPGNADLLGWDHAADHRGTADGLVPRGGLRIFDSRQTPNPSRFQHLHLLLQSHPSSYEV